MALLTRAELHEALVGILGSENVYYDPPATVKMKYPCIVYSLAHMHNRSANNGPVYIRYDSYTVTFIAREPEQTRRDSVPERLLAMGGSVFDRDFTGDNLHHYVFTVYLG